MVEHLLLEIVRLGDCLHLPVTFVGQLENMSRTVHRMDFALSKRLLL